MKADSSVQVESIRPEKEKRAFRLSLILGVLSILMAVASYASRPPGSSYGSIVAISIVAVVSLITAVLTRRHRITTGITLLAITINICFAYFITQTEGLGLLIGILIVLIPTGLAATILPPKPTQRILLGSIITGMLVVFADVFYPATRPVVPRALTITSYAMTALILVIFSIYFARNFASYRLGTKLIATTTIVAVTAVFVVAIFVNQITRSALDNAAGNSLVTYAESQGLAVGELLARQVNILEALALDATLHDRAIAANATYLGNPEETVDQLQARNRSWQTAAADSIEVTTILDNQLSVELERFAAAFPEQEHIIVTNQYGGLIAATEKVPNFYHGDDAWWQATRNQGIGANYISEPTLSPSGLIVYLAVPIYHHEHSNSGDSVIGILRSTYRLSTVGSIIAAGQFGESGSIELHLPDAQKLSLEPDTAVMTLSEATAVPTLATGNFINSEYNGQSAILSQATVQTLMEEPAIDNLGWHLVAFQTQAEAVAAADAQQRLNILLGQIVVLVAAGVAAFVGRRLAQPITNLTETAVAISEGDFNARAQVPSNDEIGSLARAINTMTDRLQTTLETLETRVRDRTRALEVSAEVSRNLSTILNQEELTRAVTEQVRNAFNFYHVHIYLWNEARTQLRLVGGTGEAAVKMMANNHALVPEQGLVGQAAVTNQPILVSDVGKDPRWLANPLLPETAAEAAIPISLGDMVLGVLDVQHHSPITSSGQEIDLLLSIANQVAIALQNTQLLADSQEQAQREAAINSINQKIMHTTSIAEALQVAVRELGQATNASHTAVRLRPENTANGRAGTGLLSTLDPSDKSRKQS